MSPAAQDRPAAPRLVPTGRAFARGDGDVARCLVRDDSANMLTVGVAGDLVWWDLRTRRPLRWLPPADEPIVALQLHPVEPWVVCRLAGGSALRVDLVGAGRWTLTAPQADALPPPPGGWLTGGHGSTTDVASRDGRHRIVATDGRRRRDPHAAGQFFTPGAACWLANDGTAIEAMAGGLRLRGLAFGDRHELHEHCGPPQRLCFTPDGGHLAILGTAGAQVVDVAGNEVSRLAGPHLVLPGPGPDEFWWLTATSMQRWSATRRAPVGEAVKWPGRRLHLFAESAAGGRRLRPVLVRHGQPWTEESARMPDGSFRPLAFTRPRAPGPLSGLEQYAWLGEPETALAFLAASDTTSPMLLTSARGDTKFTRDRATLRRLADDGTTTHHATFDARALWLALDATGVRVWIGLATGTVHLFDGARLAPLATAPFDPPLVGAVALASGQLLATTGSRLLVLDGTTLAVTGAVPLPAGLAGADQLVRCVAGPHVAIARGGDVRIARVE